MKMTLKALPLMTAAGAVLVSMVASASVDAAEITVFRGSETIVVNTNAPQKGPHVLRGGMGMKVAKRPREDVEDATVDDFPTVVGAGSTVWLRLDDGLVACSLRGTGYVGERRIYCAGE